MSIDLKQLIKAGVHFGHQTSRWMPKMEPYIWGAKNKVHLIDVSKTAHQMERAAQFLEKVSAEGKQVLWVGTKKSAREAIQAAAGHTGMPFVNYRWVGGTLSNFSQVKKSVTRLLHYEDVLAEAEKHPHYTKKELSGYKKSVDRLGSIVGGMRNLRWPVGALVLVDVNKEASALKEAVSMGVPVVALVDTNADPSLVDYVIPANDDAPRAIQVILEYLSAGVEAGKKRAVQQRGAEKAVAAAAAAIEAEGGVPVVDLVLTEEEEEEASRARAQKKAAKLVKKEGEDEAFDKNRPRKKLAPKATK